MNFITFLGGGRGQFSSLPQAQETLVMALEMARKSTGILELYRST
jgi:hypothetical protein